MTARQCDAENSEAPPIRIDFLPGNRNPTLRLPTKMSRETSDLRVGAKSGDLWAELP